MQNSKLERHSDEKTTLQSLSNTQKGAFHNEKIAYKQLHVKREKASHTYTFINIKNDKYPSH